MSAETNHAAFDEAARRSSIAAAAGAAGRRREAEEAARLLSDPHWRALAAFRVSDAVAAAGDALLEAERETGPDPEYEATRQRLRQARRLVAEAYSETERLRGDRKKAPDAGRESGAAAAGGMP